MTTRPSVPLITTVIPTYRRPKLLRRAILSVLNQTYPHVSVCVYDNASGDETEEVVRQLIQKDDRIKYHCHPENVGSYNNFNYGLKNVETPFFSLLSDDDVLVPSFYEKAVGAFRRYPDAMLVCMPTLVIDSHKRIISPPVDVKVVRFYVQGEGFNGMANVSIPNTWTGIVFRKEVIDEIGLVNLDAGPFADGGYILHAAARFPFVASPDIGAVLMAHDESASRNMMPLNGMWTIWRERIIQNIEKDEYVPLFVKHSIRKVISSDLKRIAFYQVSRALSSGNIQYADKVAAGIGGCGYPIVSLILKILVFGYRWIPPVKLALLTVKNIRLMFLKRAIDRLTLKYEKHIKFIDKLEIT